MRLILLLCAVFAMPAQAQFPDRPIRLVIGFAAGGSTDVVARVVAQAAQARLGQPIIIENRASAVLAADLVARAAPNGHTLLVATVSHAANALLVARLPYDPIADFTGIAFIGRVPTVATVHPSVPAHSLQELLALLRGEPGRYTYGSAGVGSATHLAGELLRHLTGVEMVHVPYRGNGPAMQAALSGEVHILFDTVPGGGPNIRAGLTRGLAVAAPQRNPGVPLVPTSAEAGVPEWLSDTWNVVLAPAQTPPAIVEALYAGFAEAVRATDARLVGLGVTPQPETRPETIMPHVQREIARWRPIVAAAGIRAE